MRAEPPAAGRRPAPARPAGRHATHAAAGRRAVLAAALALGVAPRAFAAAGAPAFDLAALMARLAAQRHGAARFTEQRFVQGIDAPLLSSGLLGHAAPDRLVRRTLVPRAESFAVEGNTLTLTRGGRSRSVALDSVPELVAVVEALRGTLAGDAAVLQRHFRSAVAGSADAWTLELTPLDAQLAAQVRLVRIAGSGGDLRSVEMRYTGGDRSLTLVEPLRGDAAAAAAASLAEAPQPAAGAAMPAARP